MKRIAKVDLELKISIDDLSISQMEAIIGCLANDAYLQNSVLHKINVKVDIKRNEEDTV